MAKSSDKAKKMSGSDRHSNGATANKALLWYLPELKSSRLGKVGPAFGIDGGCGLGFGVGLLGDRHRMHHTHTHRTTNAMDFLQNTAY